MAAGTFAMEAATYQTAALIDSGARRLHARNRHAQGLRHRRAVADHQRHDPDLRRQGLLHRRAVRTHDARRPHQHDRRRSQRRAAGVRRPGRHARRRPGTERRARRAGEPASNTSPNSAASPAERSKRYSASPEVRVQNSQLTPDAQRLRRTGRPNSARTSNACCALTAKKSSIANTNKPASPTPRSSCT